MNWSSFKECFVGGVILMLVLGVSCFFTGFLIYGLFQEWRLVPACFFSLVIGIIIGARN